MSRKFLASAMFLVFTGVGSAQAPQMSYPTVLHSAEAAKLLPEKVFFDGQSAPIQARNSGGVQVAKDSVILIALVDTSGYSSQVQQKYQAYLISETALDVEGHRLPPGAYGVGFIAEGRFVVMDIGGHDLFTVAAERDTALRRPTPLQLIPETSDTHRFRLYEGRSFVFLGL